MRKRRMSAFERGYAKAISDKKSVKANVEALMSGETPDSAWRAKAGGLSGLLARIVPDWLYEVTGIGSDGGERVTEKEMLQLANNLSIAGVELTNVGDVTSAYAKEADMALEEFGSAFGRLINIVDSYQQELSTVAPNVWESYPELFDYKVMVLDNLVKQMMPYAKVLEFAEGIESALNELTDDIDEHHEYLLRQTMNAIEKHGVEIPDEYWDLLGG